MNRPLAARLRRSATPRSGAAMLEFAFVFPVFMLTLFAMFEFGRAFMVIEILNSACRIAARMGVTDGVTTAQIQEEMYEFLDVANIPRSYCRIYIMDGSGFDSDPFGANKISDLTKNYPASQMDMSKAAPRALGIFRAETDFNKVAFFKPIWLHNVTLSGQVVMRRE